ncbi:MAG TPA: hypothetical protein VK152_08910 [Paludibacter sp.]|nr:hypothetical protein [Paludibacter sp.]
MFDLSGQCVLQSSINNQTNVRVSIKGIEAGVYTLQVDGFYLKVFVAGNYKTPDNAARF